MSATQEEPLFNVSETAQYLSVSRRTVYDLVASGKLPAFRVGGQIRFDRAALAAWLASHKTNRP
jgi:putative molybdopterin biosynthesis protein